MIKLINDLEQTKRPLILFISKEKGNYSKFSDIRLATYMQKDDDKIKTYSKILSYLWEKDCYFNERGNISCKLSAANLFYKKPKGLISLKILLIGLKRSGKSTLINIISKKLTALELPNDESVTKKITEYDIYPLEDEEQNNISCIKFYDTPGIENSKSFNSESIIIDFLKKKFDQIDLIYFLKRGGAIEDGKKVLEKIISLNKERIKKKLTKIPIIFIINGDINVKGEASSVAINTIKDYLINNFGNDLYEEDKQLNNDDSDDDSDENENNKKKKYIDGNIIKVNLRKQEDDYSYQKIYGINNLFKKSLEYLKSTNSLRIDDLNELKEINMILIDFFKAHLKGMKYNSLRYYKLIDESKSFISKIMKENSLLKTISFLRELCWFDKFKKTIWWGLMVSYCMIFQVFRDKFNYELFHFNLVKFIKSYIVNVSLDFCFEEVDIANYNLEGFIYPELIENNEEEIKNNIKNAKDFFEKLLLFTNDIQVFIKSFEIYKNIFKSLEILGNTNNDEWNNFKEKEV